MNVSFELSALLISVITGVFLGIPSGPVLFFVLDTCLKEGKAAALRVYAGFMGSKILYMGLALLANDFISSHQKVETAFYLFASALLMVWGVVMAVKSRKQKKRSSKTYAGSLYKNGFWVGLSNPVIPFVYLTFLQFIKAYATDVTTLKYLLNFTIMEAVSFLVLAGIAGALLSGGRLVQQHWNKAIGLMGILLFCAGAWQVYNMVDVRKQGVTISNEENVLEQQLEGLEEKSQ